jgi:uncharacterized membrane protein
LDCLLIFINFMRISNVTFLPVQGEALKYSSMQGYPVLYLSIAVIMAVVFVIICVAFLLDSYQKRKQSGGRRNLFQEYDDYYDVLDSNQDHSMQDFKSI